VHYPSARYVSLAISKAGVVKTETPRRRGRHWHCWCAGPIVTLTLGNNPVTALTLVAKWYHEFDAENTLEGNVVVASASFKF
jgi:hypothetical protein